MERVNLQHFMPVFEKVRRSFLRRHGEIMLEDNQSNDNCAERDSNESVAMIVHDGLNYFEVSS